MIVIGVDPGAKTGLAAFLCGKLIALNTCSPWDISRYLHDLKAGEAGANALVFEDSRLQSHVWTAGGASRAALAKVARNIGQVDAWCSVIESACLVAKVKCIPLSPKDKGAKLGAAEFARITGWKKKSNQHERDAAMCAWPMRNMSMD